MSAQENLQDLLKKLFLNLEVSLPPKLMVGNSPLKFEWSIRKGVGWPNGDKSGTNDNHIFSTSVDKNTFISLPIQTTRLSVKQTQQEMLVGVYNIREEIVFYNAEDMMNEYYNLISKFEKFSYRIKTLSTQNENFETKLENTDILFDDEKRKSKLSFLFSMPTEDGDKKEYRLIVTYLNDDKALN